ncbi:hypothetical protein SAMN04488499_1003130 [Sporomusa acidovorans]|nr:hypothetical protein [Sporomusa acidovorans]OZC18956.1 hypothetical protein SPACI_30420 [Sporomusa acidovorans DSM 3132]SDD70678.1 hypothetical protein SAMN04488499_1003130 [Sporomusa acidovorans]
MNNIERKNSEEKESDNKVTKRSSIVSSILFSVILNLIWFLLNILKDGSYRVEDNAMTAILSYYLISLIALLTWISIPLFLFCSCNVINIFRENSFSEQFNNSLFWLAVKNFVAASLMLIFLFPGLYMLFKFESYLELGIAIAVLVIIFCVFLYWIERKKIYTHNLVKVQIFILICFTVILLFGNNYVTTPRLIIEKERYGTNDKSVIIEIRGQHILSKAKMINTNNKTEIPVTSYSANNISYVVADLTAPSAIAGVYKIEIEAKGNMLKHTIFYTFDGSSEEKEKYIDKYLLRAKSKMTNCQINDTAEDLLKLKNLLISEKNNEAAETLATLKNKKIPIDSLMILQELYRNPIVNNSSKARNFI